MSDSKGLGCALVVGVIIVVNVLSFVFDWGFILY